MNLTTKIENWADSHHPRWIDFIRVALGLWFRKILYG